MVELQIKISTNKQAKTIDLVLPDKWEELSESNILYIGKYWQSWQLMIANKMSLTKAKAMLFMELTGIKSNIRRKELMLAISRISPESGINMLDFTAFVFEKFDLVKNLIPEIVVSKDLTYCGPSDRLSNISVDEFTFAFSCYSQWHKTNEEHYLDKLAGVLYRPRNASYESTGELREPFNNKLIAKHELIFRNLDDGYKNAIYLFFKGCIEYLLKRYEEIFRSGNKGSQGGSFKDIVVEISGGRFGTFTETKNENLYVILDELKKIIIENQKRKNK